MKEDKIETCLWYKRLIYQDPNRANGHPGKRWTMDI